VHIKDKKKHKDRAKRIVSQVKTTKHDPNESTVLKTKLYGGFEENQNAQNGDLSTNFDS